jgi:hypothetical protein
MRNPGASLIRCRRTPDAQADATRFNGPFVGIWAEEDASEAIIAWEDKCQPVTRRAAQERAFGKVGLKKPKKTITRKR